MGNSFVRKRLVVSSGTGSGTGSTLSGFSTSGTDTYTATPNPSLTSYNTNEAIVLNFSNKNTGPSTINLNGLGAKNIYKNINTPVEAGDLYGETMLVYDGTNFQILTSSYTENSLKTLNVFNYNNFY